MTRVILLDSGPLGLLVHPRQSGPVSRWIESLSEHGSRVVIPAIIYYELRRELVRMRRDAAVSNLDAYVHELGYADVTLAVLQRASTLWAESRQQGRPTAGTRDLDVDVILAATGLELLAADDEVIVATGNVRHIGQWIAAARWEDIGP